MQHGAQPFHELFIAVGLMERHETITRRIFPVLFVTVFLFEQLHQRVRFARTGRPVVDAVDAGIGHFLRTDDRRDGRRDGSRRTNWLALSLEPVLILLTLRVIPSTGARPFNLKIRKVLSRHDFVKGFPNFTRRKRLRFLCLREEEMPDSRTFPRSLRGVRDFVVRNKIRNYGEIVLHPISF